MKILSTGIVPPSRKKTALSFRLNSHQGLPKDRVTFLSGATPRFSGKTDEPPQFKVIAIKGSKVDRTFIDRLEEKITETAAKMPVALQHFAQKSLPIWAAKNNEEIGNDPDIKGLILCENMPNGGTFDMDKLPDSLLMAWADRIARNLIIIGENLNLGEKHAKEIKVFVDQLKLAVLEDFLHERGELPEQIALSDEQLNWAEERATHVFETAPEHITKQIDTSPSLVEGLAKRAMVRQFLARYSSTISQEARRDWNSRFFKTQCFLNFDGLSFKMELTPSGGVSENSVTLDSTKLEKLLHLIELAAHRPKR